MSILITKRNPALSRQAQYYYDLFKILPLVVNLHKPLHQNRHKRIQGMISNISTYSMSFNNCRLFVRCSCSCVPFVLFKFSMFCSVGVCVCVLSCSKTYTVQGRIFSLNLSHYSPTKINSNVYCDTLFIPLVVCRTCMYLCLSFSFTKPFSSVKYKKNIVLFVFFYFFVPHVPFQFKCYFLYPKKKIGLIHQLVIPPSCREHTKRRVIWSDWTNDWWMVAKTEPNRA